MTVVCLGTTFDFLADYRRMCWRSGLDPEEVEKETQGVIRLLQEALLDSQRQRREQAISILDAVCGFGIRKGFVGDNQLMVEARDRNGQWQAAYAGELPLVYEGRLVQETYPFLLRQYRGEPAHF